MAESITIKALQDASLDAKSLEEVVNGNDVKQVTTRLGESYPSVKKAIKTLFENGGLPATPYRLQSEILGVGAAEGDYAVVTDDPDAANNGFYIVTGGAWVKSNYNPLIQSIANSNALFKPRALVLNENLDNLPSGHYYVPSKAVAESLINLPAQMSTPKIAYLFVFNINGIMYQHIVHYLNSKVEEFKRVGNALAVYQSWQKKLELSDIQVSSAPTSGFLVGIASGINFDHVNSNLIIAASTVRVVYGKTSSLLPAQVLPYPAKNANNLVYTIASNSLSWIEVSNGISDGQVIVGSFLAGFNVILGIDNYLINGAAKDKIVFVGKLIGEPSAINFDFNTGKLEIAASQIRLLVGNTTSVIPARSVDLPLANDAYWYRIVCDPKTRIISFKITSAVLVGDEIVLGYIQSHTKTIYGIDGYYINGQPVKKEVGELDYIVINGDTDASYVQPTLPDYKAYITTNTSHTAIYTLYDNLMAANSSYISKTLLGKDSQNNDIYRYDFKAKDVETAVQSKDKAKIILMSAVHGEEKAGVYNLFSALKEITERWQVDSKLETLRWNVHFIVIPVAVPSGFDANDRQNGNGVDVARNFTSEWQATDPSVRTYGGAAPLDQLEAQYLDAIYAENTDAIYCGSHHNFGLSAEPPSFVWNAAVDKYGVRLAKSLVSRLTRAWYKEHTWMPAAYGDYIGYASSTSPKGSESRHAQLAYGIPSSTFEISLNIKDDPSGDLYSTNVATLGCEALVNWLLLNVEHGTKLKNSKAIAGY